MDSCDKREKTEEISADLLKQVLIGFQEFYKFKGKKIGTKSPKITKNSEYFFEAGAMISELLE